MNQSSPDAVAVGCKKMRVLCLHGFDTNAYIMEMQVGMSVLGKKPLSDMFDLVFVDAPHRTADESTVDDIVRTVFGPQDPAVGYRKWWSYRNGAYDGMEASLRSVARTIAERGPFDGVCGFSQGGTLALHLIADQLRRRDDPAYAAGSGPCPPSQFTFGIVFSAQVPRVPSRGAELYPLREAGAGRAPGCVYRDFPVFGLAQADDASVPSSMTRAAVDFFADGLYIENESGGHKVGQVDKGFAQVVRFFDRVAQGQTADGAERRYRRYGCCLC